MGIVVVLLAGSVPVAQAQVQRQARVAQSSRPEAEKVERGRRSFFTLACYSCHGHQGQGSDSGPRLDTTRLSLQGLTRYVRQPAGSMPPYRTQEQVSDAALGEIYAYLQSLPRPPDPKNIPLLQDE
jgi:mono/diheme cytochrome c family protein